MKAIIISERYPTSSSVPDPKVPYFIKYLFSSEEEFINSEISDLPCFVIQGVYKKFFDNNKLIMKLRYPEVLDIIDSPELVEVIVYDKTCFPKDKYLKEEDEEILNSIDLSSNVFKNGEKCIDKISNHWYYFLLC